MTEDRPVWAERAHIKRDPRFDQYKVDVVYQDGGNFVLADTLYFETEPEAGINRHYPGIPTERINC